MKKPLRIAFMGTPDFVIPTIQSIIESPHDLVCVYTQPPREKGRHKKLEKTPVHVFAEENNIETRHPQNFKLIDDLEKFQDLNLDVAIVAAYGLLLPQPILDAPKFGCVNIHPSLLPRWRGPSPIQYAIWKGDKETGVSVMSLEKSMDTGPIIAQSIQEITPTTNFESLNINLWKKGTSLLGDVLDNLSKTNQLQSTPQSSENISYCKLLTKEDGRINWSQSSLQIDCQIRGLNPWPGTWCLNKKNSRIKILQTSVLNETSDKPIGTILNDGKIVCGHKTILNFQKIQPENKNPMLIHDALNGGYLNEGDLLL